MGFVFELGDDHLWPYDACLGFVDEEADRLARKFLELRRQLGCLLGFGYAQEDQAWDVVGDGVEQVVLANELHSGVDVLELDVAMQRIPLATVGEVELRKTSSEDAPVSADFAIFGRVFTDVAGAQSALQGLDDAAHVVEIGRPADEESLEGFAVLRDVVSEKDFVNG